jgi:hypothetical protein
MPANVIFDHSLRAAFKSHSSTPIVSYTEYLEFTRFPDENSRQELYRSYRLKYAHRKFDLIITAGSGALIDTINFVGEVFSGAPLIFYLAIFQDGTGMTMAPADTLAPIAQAANAPIYGVSDTYLEYGALGGQMLGYEGREWGSRSMVCAF